MPAAGSSVIATVTTTRLLHVALLILVTKTQLSHEKSASGSKEAPTTGAGAGAGQQQQHHHHHHFDPLLSMSTDKHVTVETVQGRIRGRVLSFQGEKSPHTVGAFLGIPYAQPPLRELRFRAPVPPKDWTGIFNATDFSPICHQPGEQKIYDVVSVRNRSSVRKRKLENYNMSEDCLTLNIYVPLVDSGEIKSNEHIHKPAGSLNKLPVFFYIHGGSYYMGAGRLYPGQILAGTQNLIVVTFNFRLGPMGFFSTGDEAAPGNYGLLDQSQALTWVQGHIGTFGGDKDRITVVGNSAGGASVMFHLVSPLSMGKFVGVTIQSGCASAPWAIQHNPAKHAEDLAKKLGCPTVPSTDLVDCIRTFSPRTIMKNANLEDGLSLAYAAVIDGNYGGKFLSAHPDTLIKQNQFANVPVLGGFTKDEVTIWFTKLGPTSPVKHLGDFLQHDVESLLRSMPDITEANQAAALHAVKVQYLYRYGISPNDTLGRTSAVSDFISDVGLKAPCISEMNLLAKYNTKPVYIYEFHYYSIDDVKMNRQEWIGSYHESELQFIFGEAYLNYSNHLRSYDDKKMSDLMMKLWGNFVRYGNPTPELASKRERAIGEKGELDTRISGGPSSSLERERSKLKFKWTNYTNMNQDYAILGLKSHMEKYYYTERMLFWNFFFPIFRDYAFVYPTSSSDLCSDWSFVLSNWIFWLLISIISCLLVVVFVLVFCHARYFRISAMNASSSNGLTCHNYNHASHHHHHRHTRTSRSRSCGNTMSVVTNNNISSGTSGRRYSHPTHSNNLGSVIGGSVSTSASPYSKPKQIHLHHHYGGVVGSNRRASSVAVGCTVETITETDAEHQDHDEESQHIISISPLSPQKTKTLI